ncbi:MAG: hypothetical protein GY807_01905 [Gammaproteobacteria bacterium]|nr:hypothetical protein [Gammaproteobacteria bacterium]
MSTSDYIRAYIGIALITASLWSPADAALKCEAFRTPEFCAAANTALQKILGYKDHSNQDLIDPPLERFAVFRVMVNELGKVNCEEGYHDDGPREPYMCDVFIFPPSRYIEVLGETYQGLFWRPPVPPNNSAQTKPVWIDRLSWVDGSPIYNIALIGWDKRDRGNNTYTKNSDDHHNYDKKNERGEVVKEGGEDCYDNHAPLKANNIAELAHEMSHAYAYTFVRRDKYRDESIEVPVNDTFRLQAWDLEQQAIQFENLYRYLAGIKGHRRCHSTGHIADPERLVELYQGNPSFWSDDAKLKGLLSHWVRSAFSTSPVEIVSPTPGARLWGSATFKIVGLSTNEQFTFQLLAQPNADAKVLYSIQSNSSEITVPNLPATESVVFVKLSNKEEYIPYVIGPLPGQ